MTQVPSAPSPRKPQDMVLAFGNLLNGKQLGIHALRSLANLPVKQQLIKIEEFCAETD